MEIDKNGSGWGCYKVYDAAGSNQQAEAMYFATLRRLVIMTYGEEHGNQTIIVEFAYPGVVEVAPATNAESIGRYLKERFNTEYVTFHPFQDGD